MEKKEEDIKKLIEERNCLNAECSRAIQRENIFYVGFYPRPMPAWQKGRDIFERRD